MSQFATVAAPKKHPEYPKRVPICQGHLFKYIFPPIGIREIPLQRDKSPHHHVLDVSIFFLPRVPCMTDFGDCVSAL